jgi:tRNA nucleotidyltransferase/poly(A) polymerase
MPEASIATRAPWLCEPDTQRLLAVLSEGGEEARIAGGAVRNALMGLPVNDVDLATTTLPEETLRRAEAAGMRVAPTGIEHGTVTVIAKARVFEVTTLRADIETDGRRARVAFGRDWRTDAERRDFTINALYADGEGRVFDYVGGLVDIESRTIRFIGDPEARIREDFLRILRFFRMFAWYGHGRPDAEGLKACARLKDGLDRLAAERIRAELMKLLAAPDPARALLWMRQTGVLGHILPETEKWGIDLIHSLVEAESSIGLEPDAMLRLIAILPPNRERIAALAERLRLSRAETHRLLAYADQPLPSGDMEGDRFRRLLYRADTQALRDRLAILLADALRKDGPASARAETCRRLFEVARSWQPPRLPLDGTDLEALGMPPGPALGAALRTLEERWVESGFTLSREQLLLHARRLVAEARGQAL